MQLAPKNIVYDDLLGVSEGAAIANALFAVETAERQRMEVQQWLEKTKKPLFMGAYDFRPALTLEQRFRARLIRDYGPLQFRNNYTRIYRNGNDLPYHTDRPDCDVTLSVCLYHNLTHSWPLVISNIYHEPPWPIEDDKKPPRSLYEHSTMSYMMHPGTGVACHASRYPHWRERLECRPDQAVVHAFYHYQFARE